MNYLLTLALAGTVSMEALLFSFVQEQQYDSDCAQAVVESAVNTYWMTDADITRDSPTGDFSLSVLEITTLLDDIGLLNRAYWLSWDLVRQGTRQFGPVIVHFDRPHGHYAIAFGSIDGRADTMVLGDPARGTVIVSPLWWKRHSSGAAVVIDGHINDIVRDAVMDNAEKRWMRLEAVRDGR